jgi:hypothetical protein
MPDDVRERWQAWLSGETFVHPDSPAGGGGCGASRPPGSCGPQSSYSSALHPDAPAGRYWLPESSAAEPYDSAAAAADVEQTAEVFAARAAAFRDALPDSALKAAFERHLAWIQSRRGFRPNVDSGGVDRDTLLLRLRESVGWVAPNFSDMMPSGRVARAASNGDRDADAERLIESVYNTANDSIKAQWVEATRSGAARQGELVRTWARNMDRVMRRAHVMSGTEREPELKHTRLSDLVAISPSKAIRLEKTWVEFQLVDDDGAPIPNAAFEVTLTDGSIMTGRLNSSGACRFENIDPGNCQIKFPEIDAKEWKSA